MALIWTAFLPGYQLWIRMGLQAPQIRVAIGEGMEGMERAGRDRDEVRVLTKMPVEGFHHLIHEIHLLAVVDAVLGIGGWG